MPRVPRPKILLVDLRREVESRLINAGYDVASMGFGAIHVCKLSSSTHPLQLDFTVSPDYKEREVVFVDLGRTGALRTYYSKWDIGFGVKCICQTGEAGEVSIDSYAKSLFQDDFDRILDHGGMFVIFMEPRKGATYVQGTLIHWYGASAEIEHQGTVKTSNLAFVSILENPRLVITHDLGQEITAQGDSSVSLSLRRYLRGAGFTAKVHAESSREVPFTPLAVNKYGETVSALLGPLPSKGAVLLVPRIEDVAGFIEDLLKHSLPDLVPHLFPDTASRRWTAEPAYDLPAVSSLRTRQAEAIAEADRKAQELQAKMDATRGEYGFMYDICTETGGPLVQAVKKGLEFLGLTKVVDVDKSGDALQEDLRVEDWEPWLVIEVKGLSASPRDQDLMEVVKYKERRAREHGRVVQGLSVINHQRHLPPEHRDNNAFSDAQVRDAGPLGYGLLTTWDMFRLLYGVVALNWPKEAIAKMLWQSGRILPVPPHYSEIGVVDRVWPKAPAFGVTLTSGSVKRGDTLAYEEGYKFCEARIESLEVYDKGVVEVTPPEKVGVKLTAGTLPREKARVFKVG